MAQDRLLELAQCRRRFQSQFFGEDASELAIDLKSLGLPAAAIEGEHELATKALPERMVGHHPTQLSRKRARRAQRQVRLVPFLQASQLQFLQPGDLGLREGLVAEIGKRWA